MKIAVLKFGGTSVGTGERLVQVANVVRGVSATFKPIVVLSAMSGLTKSLGTTSRLLEAIDEILTPDSVKYLQIVDEIEASHLKASKDALSSHACASILAALERDIKSECARLKLFMSATEIVDELSARSRDVIVSMGEKLSARVFAAGIPSKYINLDRLIEKKFDPKKLDRSFYEYLSQRLEEWTAPFVQTHVCVVTGFFGPCPGSLLDTVGRGYTDLTAALVAVGIKAAELQIWKEVDGVFTADPRKVPKARKLHSISPEEAAELTYYGSEIIHPFTMEQVIRASIPIRIKNTFNPSGEGTLIVPDGMLPVKSSSLKRPTAITLKDNVTVLSIISNRRTNSHKFFAQIFSILDKHGMFVDLISTSKAHISIALATNLKDSEFEPIIAEMTIYGAVSILKDQVILSLVGKEIRNMEGASSLMFTSLAQHGVNIEMISQGASEINVFCVIHKSNGLKALKCIHNDMIDPHHDVQI